LIKIGANKLNSNSIHKNIFISWLPENNRLELIWKLAQVDFKKSIIYYIVLSRVFRVNESNFAFILFSGMILWMTFTESSRKGMNILKSKRYLIQSIRFNWVDLHISSVFSVFIGFSFNLFAYLIIALLAGISFSVHILFFPLILIVMFILCVGFSLLLSVAHIYLKDIEHLWTMLVLFGFWTSGVFQRSEVFLEVFPMLKYLHPFFGIIQNSRQLLLYNGTLDWGLLLYNFGYALTVFFVGN